MKQKKASKKTILITETARTKEIKRSKKPSIFILIPLFVITIFVITTTIYKLVEFFSATPSKFPRIDISLLEVPIERINIEDKNIKYPGNTITLTVNGETNIFENVEIKGRGNTTWKQPKRPYQFKLNNKTNLLNLNKAKKWILLANYLDRSHLRNNIAFYLEKMLDEPYSLSGNYVELYVDDYYLGLYFLTEKIEIDKYSINLQDPLGIIVELDNIYGGSKDIHIRTSNNDYIALYDTVNEDLEEPAIKHFVTNFNNLESAVKEQDYSKISSIIDVDSFAKYFLLSEFTINPDAYSSSFFLYKDGEKDKIHAGPGWDFDIGFGNREWNNTEVDYSPFYSPFESTIIKDQIPTENTPVELTDYLKSISTIIYDLLDIPEFSTRVREIYQSTLSGKGDELLNYIRNQADYIRDAVYRDQARWKYDTDFNEEVDYLIDWVTKRYQHFEETYGPESPNPNDNTESVSIESINSINSIENSEF